MDPAESEPKKKPNAVTWLILPWISVGVTIGAYAFDLPEKILDPLPYGLGKIAEDNLPIGLVLVTIGCSTRWAYLRLKDRSSSKASLIGGVIGLTVLLTLSQACAMAGVAFVGCLVLFGEPRS